MRVGVFLLTLLMGKLLLAVGPVGPVIECRFMALEVDGGIGLDESALYVLDPANVVTGSFDPYGIEIAIYGGILTVGIYLDGDPLGASQIALGNVLSVPLGVPVLGLNTIYHEPEEGFVGIQYACRLISL